jgi:hypothetical protein
MQILEDFGYLSAFFSHFGIAKFPMHSKEGQIITLKKNLELIHLFSSIT